MDVYKKQARNVAIITSVLLLILCVLALSLGDNIYGHIIVVFFAIVSFFFGYSVLAYLTIDGDNASFKSPFKDMHNRTIDERDLLIHQTYLYIVVRKDTTFYVTSLTTYDKCTRLLKDLPPEESEVIGTAYKKGEIIDEN